MRLTPVLCLLLLAASALPTPTSAQPSFSQSYQLRAGMGDLSTTAAHEPAGNWSVEQRLTLSHKAGTAESAALTVPLGARILSAACACNATHNTGTSTVSFIISSNNPSGQVTVTVATTQSAASAIAGAFTIPTNDAVAILYVPAGDQADTPLAVGTTLTSTDGTSKIQVYGEQGGLPGTFWFAIHPTTSQATPPARAASSIPWLYIAIAFVAGAILWALMVSRGFVQAKGRKQVMQTAAHVEAAREDPAPVLEGKKRALMAALKEIEVAKMNQEMDAAVYDQVKAEFKKQTVTVMRALESGTGQK